MSHMCLTKCQYKLDLIRICLKIVITRTHYRGKEAYDKMFLHFFAYVTQAKTTVTLFT